MWGAGGGGAPPTIAAADLVVVDSSPVRNFVGAGRRPRCMLARIA